MSIMVQQKKGLSVTPLKKEILFQIMLKEVLKICEK